MRSTLSMHQYQKPPFEPQARYIAARPLKWGNNASGYITIPAARDDALDTAQTLDFEHMTPPIDATVVARLYRTGFLAMLLTDDGKPLLRGEEPEPLPPVAATTNDGYRQQANVGKSEPAPAPAPAPEPVRATCPRCGRQFKGRHVPHFHKVQCEKAA